MNRFVSSTILPIIAVGTACGLFGCEKSEIHSYSVPREFQGTPDVSATPQSAAVEEPMVEWTMPDAWTELDKTVSMRLATFQAANGQEIAVTAFPGDVGGLLANVNRWRNQVGIEAIGEADVESSIERIEGTGVIIVDIQGEKDRLVGSIINVGDGKTWFAKATGPTDLVTEMKDELIAFSVSFQIHDHASHTDHEGHDTTASAPETTEPETAAPDHISTDWNPPKEWAAEADHSTMLLAAFTTASGGRVTMSELLGDGGGILANVNRWRKQLGIEIAATEAQLGIEKLGQGSVIVDLVSPTNDNRMIAAIVPIGSRTLFFKLTGDVSAVESEIERFRTCVQMVGMNNEVLP